MYNMYNMYRGANMPGSSSVEKVSPSKARENLAEIIGKVRFGKKRFIFSSRGKDIAAIVPIEDLVLLEKFEDNQDIKLARQALEEEGTVTFEDALAKLGLSEEAVRLATISK